MGPAIEITNCNVNNNLPKNLIPYHYVFSQTTILASESILNLHWSDLDSSRNNQIEFYKSLG